MVSLKTIKECADSVTKFLTVALSIYIGVLSVNPDIIYEQFKSLSEKDHKEYVELRLENGEKINAELKQIIYTMHADRAFICEFHNGSNNFAGLPFLYLDMKYEQVNDTVMHIDDEYVNFNMSRYDFFPQLFKTYYWEGTTDDLREIDARLASNFERDCIGSCAFITLQGTDGMIGVLGVTFANDIPEHSREGLRNLMVNKSQKCSALLSING